MARAQTIFFRVCKLVGLFFEGDLPVFIDQNPRFFTKIHEKNKSCQSSRSIQIQKTKGPKHPMPSAEPRTSGDPSYPSASAVWCSMLGIAFVREKAVRFPA